MFDKKKDSMNAQEIKDLRENERLDIVYTQPAGMNLGQRRVLGAFITIVITVALFFGFSGINNLFLRVQSYINSLFPSTIRDMLPSDVILILLNIAAGVILCRIFSQKVIDTPYKTKGGVKLTAISIALLSAVYLVPMLIIKLTALVGGDRVDNVVQKLSEIFLSSLFYNLPQGNLFSQVLYYILNILLVPAACLLLYLLFTQKLKSGILSWIYREPSEGAAIMAVSAVMLLGFGINKALLDNIVVPIAYAAIIVRLYIKTKSFWKVFTAYAVSMAIIYAAMRLLLNFN